MRAPKLVQHMKANADRMSEGLVRKIREAERCAGLAVRVPDDEQKDYVLSIYRDLLDWLETGSDPIIEDRYQALGTRRAQQYVPFSCVCWAVSITREYLWDYMQEECLIEEPVEFWGGVTLLRSLNQFFDRALYFTLLGYQNSGKAELNRGLFPIRRSVA